MYKSETGNYTLRAMNELLIKLTSFRLNIITKTMIFDLLSYIAEGVVLFSFVFLMKSLYDLTDLFVAGGTSFLITFELLFSLLPSIMILTFPMAVLLASLMLYGRMTQDNEITALQASGYSTYQLLVPVVIVGIVLTLLLLWWSSRIAPKGLRLFTMMAENVLQDTATAGIRPGGFNRFGGFVFFPSEVDEGRMRNLRLFEYKKAHSDAESFETERYMISGVVTAPTASIFFTPQEKTITLRLENGMLHQVPQPDRDVVIRFQEMEFTIGIPELLQRLTKVNRAEQSYSTNGLEKDVVQRSKQRYLENPSAPDAGWYRSFWKRGEIEQARRKALPFACLFMAIIGAVLGMESRFGKRSACYSMTIIVIVIYYVLLSFGKAYVEDGILPAWIGMWIPNAVSMLIAGVLIYRTQRV